MKDQGGYKTMMKDYSMTINNATVSFSVDEDWLDGINIKVTKDVEPQIYDAALADPEASCISTDDDQLNKAIEGMKTLVIKVKDINKEKNSDIRVLVENNLYTVKFAGQVYGEALKLKEAEVAVDKIKAYLDHNNLVKVRIFDISGKAKIKAAMDLEAFIANKAYKVITLADDGKTYTLVYIEKGACSRKADSWDDEDEETF